MYVYIIVTRRTQKCAVSLANHVRAVAEAFHSLRTYQRY